MISASLAFLWATAVASAPQMLVTPDSFGPVRFEMTVDEAARAQNHKLVAVPCCRQTDPTPECYYVEGRPELKGLSIIAGHGHLKAVTITAATYRTSKGITVGDNETKIKQAYGATIETSEDHYAGTNYFVWSPDKKRLLIIQAINGSVFSLSAGLVDYVGGEGCE